MGIKLLPLPSEIPISNRIGINKDAITLVGIKLEVSSPLVGRSIKNVKLANPFINHQTSVIYREDSSFIPHDDTVYQKDDVVYFLSKTDDVDLVQQMAGKPSFNAAFPLMSTSITSSSARNLIRDFLFGNLAPTVS